MTIGPPDSAHASEPAEGSRCIVHVLDPRNRVTLFTAPWETQQVAFVADVFIGLVGGHQIWATINVRTWPCCAAPEHAAPSTRAEALCECRAHERRCVPRIVCRPFP